MTPQELKASILQQAIQGKLVEQRPEEGTGEELFQQIQTEKQALIKAGKIKKEKPLPEIAEDEIPFEIPDSWKWARVFDIAYLSSGNQYQENSNGNLYVKVADMNLPDNQREIKTSSRRANIPFDNLIPVNSIIFPKRGGAISTNKKRLVCQEPIGVDSNTMAMTMISAEMLPYMSKWFASVDLGHLATGTSVPQINNKDIYPLLTPIPPLAEQKRIVAKLEDILPLIDRYEAAWNKLEELNKRFPGDMQKSILQLAIQGKLVEQRPEEGTGEELFQQIQAEKQALIKDGKIKKEKPLPEIAEDEMPFDIPDTWKWYRFGELFNIVNGFTPLKTNPDFWTDGDIPWFTIEDIRRQGRFISSTEKFITQKALSKNTERIVPAETVLLCCTASVGEYAYAKIPLTANQQFNAFVVKEHYKKAVYPLYVFEYAKTLKGSLIDRAGKTTFNFVSVGKLSNMLIPLPPLAEQKRIVAKLEEILPLCDRLK